LRFKNHYNSVNTGRDYSPNITIPANLRKKQTISQWSRELGIGKETIAYRVHAGWSAEECLFGKKNKTTNSNPRMKIPDYLSQK